MLPIDQIELWLASLPSDEVEEVNDENTIATNNESDEEK